MAQKNTYFQDEKVNTKINFKQFKRTLRYIRPHKKLFFIVLAMMIATAVLSMVPPLLLRRIINTTVYSNDVKELLLLIGGMVLLTALQIGTTYFQQTRMGKIGHTVIAKIREEVFYRLQELPFEYFDSRPNGKIVTRVTEYVNELANFFSNFVLQFIIYVLMIISATVFMLTISPLLTLVVYCAVIPMMTCIFLLRKNLRPQFTELRAKNSNRTAFVVESMMGEKIIKNCNREEVNLNIYNEVHGRCIKQWAHIYALNELNTPIVEVFWNLGLVSMFAIALHSIHSPNTALIDAGAVVAFTNYMGIFSGPLTQIAVLIQQFSQVASDLEQVFDTIDYPVSIKDKDNAKSLGKVKGQVDFNDVTFAYEEGINILEGFDLHVKPGEMIALVGPTGAGKTTVINMLTRFYDVKKGSVCIDGTDVRDLKLNELRKEVGVLMQDPFLFKGTIMENIRYGRPDATDEECIEAAEKIHADQCIKRLVGGYQHMLEERGAGLSAGERQLISFTRIILKNPSIIILDEATSSIDTETEVLIQKALEILIKGKTSFIVAHRLSTIRNADRILYISNKRIAEEGSHKELMDKHGLYYKLNE